MTSTWVIHATILLGALQKGEITLSVRVGALTKEVKLRFPPFTMVAATTEGQELTQPFKDRFGIRETMGRYEVHELVDVVLAIAKRLGHEIEEDAAWDLAEVARGTPRVAEKLLERNLVVITNGGRRPAWIHRLFEGARNGQGEAPREAEPPSRGAGTKILSGRPDKTRRRDRARPGSLRLPVG